MILSNYLFLYIHICNIKENRIKGLKNTFFIKNFLFCHPVIEDHKNLIKKVTKMNELKIISLTFKTIFCPIPRSFGILEI